LQRGAVFLCTSVPYGSADGGHGCGFPSDARRAVAVVVVTSPCWLLGSCAWFLSELYGVSGAGGLLSCSRLAHPSGISNPVGLGLPSVVLRLSTTRRPPRAVRVFHASVLYGVSLLCDALRLQHVAHRRSGVVSAACNLLVTPPTQVVSARRVASDVRCLSTTSTMQCRGWVSADQGRSITPVWHRAGLSLLLARPACSSL
jgi:hypothetical protein